MKGNEIRRSYEALQRCWFDPFSLNEIFFDVRIGCPNLKADGTGHSRNALGDPAKTNQTGIESRADSSVLREPISHVPFVVPLQATGNFLAQARTRVIA